MKLPIRLLYPILFAVLFSSTTLFPFIYEVKVLKKWFPKRGHAQYFVGCCDFHDRIDPSNLAQRQILETTLGSCDKAQTHVVVEDLATGSQKNDVLRGRFSITANGGVLGGLASVCVACGLPVTNVEYRYCRVASIGPVINNLNADYNRFSATRALTAKNLVDELFKHAKGLSGRACFKKSMNAILKTANLKRLKAAGDMSMAGYLNKHTVPTNRFAVLKTLLTFDSALLDSSILQAVSKSDKKYILTIAGGSHIDRVSERLKREGYEVVYASDPQFVRARQENACLPQGTNGQSVKPRPLKARVLKRVFKKYLK